jgi:uncharacterized lipoprotein NlpE involved in copper resistance
MRKILLVLMSLLLVYALVGCNEPQEPRVRPAAPAGQGLLYPPAPPDPITIKFGAYQAKVEDIKAGESNLRAAVPAQLEISADGKSFTIDNTGTNGYGAELYYFRVDFGSFKMYDFSKIKFDWNGQSGDLGGKVIVVRGTAAPSLTDANAYFSMETSNVAKTANIDAQVSQTFELDLDLKSPAASESVVYFTIFPHNSGAKVTIGNVTFDN